MMTLKQALLRFSLINSRLVADTPTSQVFKAHDEAGKLVALKILKSRGLAELVGARYLHWRAGQGAVQVLAIEDNLVLMEWLDGGTLGDLVRNGRDDEAAASLCDVISHLQVQHTSPPTGLMPLLVQFEPMIDGDFKFWPKSMHATGELTRSILGELQKSSLAEIPLHGDLHHDNVVNSARGWQVIDAKGLFGDPAYECSNVFRNPIGAEQLTRTPKRIDQLADIFVSRLGFERKRVLGWAVAHTALSTFWDHSAGNSIDDDLTILPFLVDAFDRS